VRKKLDNCRMKDGKIGCRTADNQDGAVLEIGENNFPCLELATRMIAPVRVVKIGICIKSRTREIGVHLLLRKIAELSPGGTTTSTMIRIRTI
jgi:hypothetical protein